MPIYNNRILFHVLIGISFGIAVLIASGIDNRLVYFVQQFNPEIKVILAQLKFFGNPVGYLVVSAAGAFIFRYVWQVETVWRNCLFFFFGGRRFRYISRHPQSYILAR